MVSRCQNLEALNLSGCTQIGDVEVLMLVKQCPGMIIADMHTGFLKESSKFGCHISLLLPVRDIGAEFARLSENH